MKKSFISISLVITSFVFLAPQIALAVWWNPFSWFKKKPVPLPVEQVVTQTAQKHTAQPAVSAQEKKKESVTESKPATKKNVEAPTTPKKESEKVSVPAPIVPLVLNEPKVTSVPLSISNITIEPQITSVYISWQTNKVSESKLLLNGIAYQSRNGVDALHYVEIKDLTGGKSYNVTITALANNAWANQEVSFNTKEATPKPVEVPVILLAVSFSYTAPTQGYIWVESNGQVLPDLASPKTEQLMWQNTATVKVRSVKLQSFKIRNTGSISNSAFENLRLYVNEAQIGVATIDGNGYASFEFTPVMLHTGENTIKVTGDIISGMDRTIIWSLRNVEDINLIDSETSQRITPTGSGPFSFPLSTGTQTIQAAK